MQIMSQVLNQFVLSGCSPLPLHEGRNNGYPQSLHKGMEGALATSKAALPSSFFASESDISGHDTAGDTMVATAIATTYPASRPDASVSWVSSTEGLNQGSSTTQASKDQEEASRLGTHTRHLQTSQFPWKLHEMLGDAETEGFGSIVSWLPDGNSFRVHKQDIFVKSIMQRYFKQTKYKSFVRQINMWGFDRIKSGPGKRGYRNPHFRRGRPSLCFQMKRTKVKGSGLVKVADTLDDPCQTNGSQPNELRSTSVELLHSRGGNATSHSWIREHELALLEFARHLVVSSTETRQFANESHVDMRRRGSPRLLDDGRPAGDGSNDTALFPAQDIHDELICTFQNR